jgi:hypothetical protein
MGRLSLLLAAGRTQHVGPPPILLAVLAVSSNQTTPEEAEAAAVDCLLSVDSALAEVLVPTAAVAVDDPGAAPAAPEVAHVVDNCALVGRSRSIHGHHCRHAVHVDHVRNPNPGCNSADETLGWD